MKIAKLAVLMLAVLLAASNLFAQGRNGQIELYGGVAFPLSPDGFKDYFKTGLSIHGQYVAFPSPRFGISFGAGYERFSFDGDKFLEDLGLGGSGLGVDGSGSIVEFGVGFRPYLTLPEASTQFFLFGMGTYNLLKTEATVSGFGQSVSDDQDENKFGIAGGAGLELPAGESMNIILQGLFRLVFTKEETVVDATTGEETTVGGSISFVGVTMGLVF